MAIRGRSGLGLSTGLGTMRTAFLSGLFRRSILVAAGCRLQEDGFFLLQEDGASRILL